jgi:phospholipid transport system substrate-binding protein
LGTLTGAIALIAASLQPAYAGIAADDAVGIVKGLLSHGIEALNDKVSPTDRRQRFRELFQADFDGPRIARFVLGGYWRQLTEAEHQQFLSLFENYLVLVYSARLADFRGETFAVNGSRADQGWVIVSTDIFTPGRAAPLRVDWRLVTDGAGFKIVDVIVDGISMIVTERSEFASIIRRHGGDIGGLLALMQEKTSSVIAATR